MPRSTAFRWLLATGLLVPHTAAAQTIRGVLVAHETGTILPFGMVELLNQDLRAVVATQADVMGRFDLVAPGPGRYALRGSHLTAQPLITEAVELAEGQVVELVLSLALQPIELDPLMVTVRPEYRPLVRNGFYDRARSGLGTFVTPEQIERVNPLRTTDLLRRIPGVRLEPHPQWGARWIVTMTRSGMFPGQISAGGGGRRCLPRVIVDDVEMVDFDVDDLATQNVFALEVYRSPVQVPPQYGGPGYACGVIVVWTGMRTRPSR